MASFEEALQFVVDCRIQLLKKMNTLHQEFERLSGMKKDTESKLETELQQPGRSSTNQVNTWLKEVEQIKGKIEDITNEINQILAYESTNEGFEELIKEVEKYQREGLPNDSENMVEGEAIVGGNVNILGQGGIGRTTINQPNAHINLNYNITLSNGEVEEGHRQSQGAVEEGHRQGNGAVGEGQR